MPTVVQLAADSNIFADNEKLVDMAPSMYEQYPSLTPLTSILTRLAMDAAINSTVYWTEEEEIPTSVAFSGTTEASAPTEDGSQTIEIDNFAYLRKDDILYDAGNFENLLVKATPTTSTVSVYRGWGTSSVGAIQAGTEFQLLIGSKVEGGDYATPRGVVDTEVFNYIQEVNEFVQTTTIANATHTHFGKAGAKRSQQQRKMFRAFRKKLEQNIYFGTRANTSLAGEDLYRKSMRGLTEFLKDGTNYKNVNGVLTEVAFDRWISDVYEAFPDGERKALVCAPKLYGVINRFGRDKIRISPNSKEYGLQIKRYTGDLEIDLIKAPLLTGSTLKGWGFLLDFDYLKLRYLLHPKLELDTYVKRANYIEDKYSAAVSLQLANEARHGLLLGVTG